MCERPPNDGTDLDNLGFFERVDVNNDGLLDIYVSNAGNMEGENHNNDLYINNGDLTFTEKAKEYNLAETGFTTHATFFDYDKDGDLDLLVASYFAKYVAFNAFANDGTGHFTEVTSSWIPSPDTAPPCWKRGR